MGGGAGVCWGRSAQIRRVRIAVCDAFLLSCKVIFKWFAGCESFYEGMDCINIHLLLMPESRNKAVCNYMLTFHKININLTKPKSCTLILLRGHHNLPT